MKRIYLIIILLVLLIIDNTLLPYYAIAGSFPSLLFVFAIAYSIILGKEEAIFIGVLTGVLQDTFFFSGFGINLFLNMILCLLCAIIGENIFKENRMASVLITLLISSLKVLGVAILFQLFSQKIDIQIGFISGVLNSICMLILYGFIFRTIDKYLSRNTWRF